MKLFATPLILFLLFLSTVLPAHSSDKEINLNPIISLLFPGKITLKDLGINTNLGPRKNPEGQELGEDAHPLLRRRTTLGKKDELFSAGMPLTGWHSNTPKLFLLDNPANGEDGTPGADPNESLFSEGTNDSWTGYGHKASIGADIDADNREEMITVYLVPDESDPNEVGSIRISFIEDKINSPDNDSFEAITQPILETLNAGSLSNSNCDEWRTCVDLTAGDLDGDGDDEIILALNTSIQKIVIIDGSDLTSSIAEYNFRQGESEKIAMVDAADLDADGKDEIAVAISHGLNQENDYIGQYDILKYDSTQSLKSLLENNPKNLYYEKDSEGFKLSYRVNVVAADIDGDQLPELVFGGKSEFNGDAQLLFLEGGRSTSLSIDNKAFSFIDLAHPVGREAGCHLSSGCWNGALEKGRFNTAPGDEIFAHASIIDFNVEDDAIAVNSSEMLDHRLDNVTRMISLFPTIRLMDYEKNITPQLVAVGDFDDTKDDNKDTLTEEIAIIFLEDFINSDDNIIVGMTFLIYGVDPDNGIWQERRRVFHRNYYMDYINYWKNTLSYATLTTANVDDDSQLVEYTGIKELVFSKPLVITALASAPYFKDYEYPNNNHGYTLYGKTRAQEFEASNTVGGSYGISWGIDVEDPLGTTGLKLKFTFTMSYDYTWTSGHSIALTSEYKTSAGRDYVVFTAIPYDIYYYEKISPLPGPTESKYFSVNVPRETKVYFSERNFYNAYNGDGDDVDERIFTHSLGDPRTYLNRNQMREQWLGKSRMEFASEPSTCPLSAGAEAVKAVDFKTWRSEENEIDGELAVEGEFVLNSVLMGASWSVHYAESDKWTASESLAIEGCVMGSDRVNASTAFDWGVVAYETDVLDSERPITVINYWVDMPD